ncbi:MAG TPA: isopentenyl phosphate kinase family protein [Candidatus Aenigmarchaeota archaeon]|nr:MAG: hypothetical protein DRP03_03390 [Candidatus Aenigmarchaeota archaeon]HDD46209.1 isopentenyl phosphate kinase family protein [Candidatus Aenigmarchaeota archaeon]
MDKSLILLKIGGSVITYKNRPFTANRKALERIAEEVAKAYKSKRFRLVLIHGAGSFGHYIAKKTGIHKGVKSRKQLIGFAITQRWQNYFNVIVTGYLNEAGLPAMPMQASAMAIMKKGKLSCMYTKAIEGMLNLGLVPVLYGVPAYDEGQGCSILSGDQIISYLAIKLKASRVLHATDVDGIYTKDPKKHRDAKLIREINADNFKDVVKMLSGSSAVDVTGGMALKVSELVGLAKRGIEAVIFNGKIKGNIKNALEGRYVGTVIKV